MIKPYFTGAEKPYVPLIRVARLSDFEWQRVRDCSLLDISHWQNVCDLSLTLKQGRKAANGRWVRIDEYKCRQAFGHFMNLLNRAVYGNAFYRHDKRLKVIPVLEKSGPCVSSAGHVFGRHQLLGRWHIHCAIEPPSHVDSVEFERLVNHCWSKVDWAHKRILLRDDTDRGWIDYMLKLPQKSLFDSWFDCIDWENLNNSTADA